MYREKLTLAIYYHLKMQGKERADITEKVKNIQKKHGWTDEEMYRYAEECYREIMGEE